MILILFEYEELEELDLILENASGHLAQSIRFKIRHALRESRTIPGLNSDLSNIEDKVHGDDIDEDDDFHSIRS